MKFGLKYDRIYSVGGVLSAPRNFQKGETVMAKKLNLNNSELFSSVLYILVGLILAIFQGGALSWVMTAVGIIFIVSGVLDVIKKNWTGGGISIVIGIAIIAFGWLLVGVVLIVLGVLIAIKGVVTLIEVLRAKKKNLMEIIYPVACIVLGIMLAFGNLLSTLILIAGILLVINGIIGVIGALKK